MAAVNDKKALRGRRQYCSSITAGQRADFLCPSPVAITQVRCGFCIAQCARQRSVDCFLGLPFNIASYGALLEILAKEVNMVPEDLIGNLGDVHLYSNHLEQAKEQISRKPFDLPKLEMNASNLINKLNEWKPSDFKILEYNSHSTIKAALS